MHNHNAAFSGPTANAILEALRVGLLLVDGKGRLVAANGVGVDYLIAGEGLREATTAGSWPRCRASAPSSAVTSMRR